MSSDQSFSSAYARAVGAIAGNEGSLTLAQFAAVTDIAGDGKSSAVFTALVLNAIESGVDVDWAFNALGRSCAGIEQAARENALSMTMPLLALHGADARSLAQRLAGDAAEVGHGVGQRTAAHQPARLFAEVGQDAALLGERQLVQVVRRQAHR